MKTKKTKTEVNLLSEVRGPIFFRFFIKLKIDCEMSVRVIMNSQSEGRIGSV